MQEFLGQGKWQNTKRTAKLSAVLTLETTP
jgi:hypothetical protein